MLRSGKSENESPYLKEIPWQPKDKLMISILQPLWVNLASSACRLGLWELVFQSTWVGQTREQNFRQMLNSRFINSHLECIWFLSCSPLCWVSASARAVLQPLCWAGSPHGLPISSTDPRCKISNRSMGEWAAQLPAPHLTLPSSCGLLSPVVKAHLVAAWEV